MGGDGGGAAKWRGERKSKEEREREKTGDKGWRVDGEQSKGWSRECERVGEEHARESISPASFASFWCTRAFTLAPLTRCC